MALNDINQAFSIVDKEGRPTDYFMRLLRDRGVESGNAVETAEEAIELVNKIDGTEFTAGDGLAGGGTLGSDDLIDYALDAGLDDLNDVDLTTTPPTDGQVMVYNSSSGLWLPTNQSGGGGGGASAYIDFEPGDPPTINSSSGIASLTRTTTGRYTITFTTAFANAYYGMAAHGRFNNSTTSDVVPMFGVDRRPGYGKTASDIDISITTDTGASSDNLLFAQLTFFAV